MQYKSRINKERAEKIGNIEIGKYTRMDVEAKPIIIKDIFIIY